MPSRSCTAVLASEAFVGARRAVPGTVPDLRLEVIYSEENYRKQARQDSSKALRFGSRRIRNSLIENRGRLRAFGGGAKRLGDTINGPLGQLVLFSVYQDTAGNVEGHSAKDGSCVVLGHRRHFSRLGGGNFRSQPHE
jgi:hypothetical protein